MLGASDSSQQAVQSMMEAIDELCQLIQTHLSSLSHHPHHPLISSASTSAAASSSRRMLPIVPGTSTLTPGAAAALLASPGSRCQSARSTDRAVLSRHISMLCFTPTTRHNAADIFTTSPREQQQQQCNCEDISDI